MTAMVGYGREGTAILNHPVVIFDILFSPQCSITAVNIGSGPLFLAPFVGGLLLVFSTTS